MALTCRQEFVSNLLTLLKTLSREPTMLGWGPVRPSPESFSLGGRGRRRRRGGRRGMKGNGEEKKGGDVGTRVRGERRE